METGDFFKLYKEEKRRSEALTILVDILSEPEFPQLIKRLPEQIANIFQATASIFLIPPEKNGRDAFVLQGTNNKTLKNRIGWIHYLPGEGAKGWVGKTAQRLVNGVASTYPLRYPELEFPYHFLPAPLVSDGKPFGVLWIARPSEETPFADEDKKLLQEISSKVARVIEHENLRGRIQNADILEALQYVKMQIHPDITSDEILQFILEQAARLSNATNGTLGVVNPKTGLLEVKAACGSLKGVYVPPLAEKDKGITRYVVNTGKPYLCEEVTECQYYLESDPNTLSELCVPLKVGGQTIGDINLESEEREHFSLEHERLLTLFAVYAGAAIVVAQPRLTDELQTLIDIGQELLLISPIDDRDDVLGRVISIAAKTLPCRRINVWLKDTTGKQIMLSAAYGGREEFIRQQFYDLDVIDESGMKGEGLTGKVATGSIPQIRTSAAREEKGWKGKYNTPEEGHPESPGSVPLMILPLRTPNDNIIGAIKFSCPYSREDYSDRFFNESDEHFALIFAQQIAVVLSAYLSFDKLQTLIDIGQELLLISPQNRDEMLTKGVSLATDTLQCERISIWLKDTTGKRIVLRAACGGREKFIGQQFYDLDVIDESGIKGEGLTGKVAAGSIKRIRTRAAREIKGEVWKGKYNRPDEGHDEPPGSVPMMILPLRTMDDIVGAIRFTRPSYLAGRADGCFNDSDERFAQAVAQLIAIAVKSTRLFEEMERSRQMATLGVMASGLAHEINQPLQIILAVAQNCTRDIQRNAIDTEGILADLEHIATNTKRIDKIVNHLQVLARERKPKLEAVDINTVIENSFIMFHQQLKSRGIKIERNFSPDLPPVKADMIQLEQVFINLINNARDALEGRANKTITISTQEQNGHIQVQFQDNGVGITLGNLPKIFDSFFTTKQEEGGMGLGLYIAQDIIQSFSGIITADSRVNEGTTFLIKLPIAGEEDVE